MAKWQGKEVTLNTPRAIPQGNAGHGKKRKEVYVKDPSSGNVKRITFGDKKMGKHPGDKSRKASYCARSGGLGGSTDRTSANYWARRDWNC